VKVKIFKWVSLAVFLAPAYGAVIGPLNIDGSVQVSATLIDWANPLGGGVGTFRVDAPVGGTFTGTELTNGTAKDLNALVVTLPVNSFLTFAALPTVHFDLDSFIPTGAAGCTGAEVLNQTCTLPGAGPGGLGPFKARVDANGVTVTMGVFGYFNDTPATGIAGTPYIGNYTTQLSGVTVSQILATLAGGPGIPGGASPPIPAGFISASYSAAFSQVSAVPEPATYGMIGFGLVSIWAFARRRKVS